MSADTLPHPGRAHRREGRRALAGTGALTRLALRRDRVMLPLWVLAIGALAIGTAASFDSLYPTVASRLPFARAIEANSGLIALTGRPYDLTTIGGLTAWRTTSFATVLTALMSLLLLVRHTRAEEESGRLELLGSAVTGRLAPLSAGLLTAVIADAGVALVVALGLTGLGLPVAGSIALGASYACCGLVFAGIAALSAQLTQSARAANGIGSALIGAAYLVRAIADATGSSWLPWLTPIGWSQQLRPYAGNRWWVAALAVAVAGGLCAAGYRMAAGRDLGAGVLPDRPGPATASARFASAAALAWRLQRGVLLGWAAGMAVLGAAVGSIAQSVSQLVSDSPQLRSFLDALGGRQGAVDSYLSTVMFTAGVTASAYAVQAVLRLPDEEASQRAEPLLSTPVGRVRWALGHLGIALLGTLVLLGAMGLTAGVAHGLRTGDVAGQLPRVLGAALVQVFAAWVFAGLAFAVFGLRSRWASAGWVAVAGSVFLGLLGPVLHLSHWVLDLSPFTHLPKLPGAEVTWTPLAWLLLLTLALSAAGAFALTRRDLL